MRSVFQAKTRAKIVSIESGPYSKSTHTHIGAGINWNRWLKSGNVLLVQARQRRRSLLQADLRGRDGRHGALLRRRRILQLAHHQVQRQDRL